MPRSPRLHQHAAILAALLAGLLVLAGCRAAPAEEPEQEEAENEEAVAESDEETAEAEADEGDQTEEGEEQAPTQLGELPPPPAPALQAPRELRLDSSRSTGLSLTPQTATPNTQGLGGRQLQLQRSPSGLQLREDGTEE